MIFVFSFPTPIILFPCTDHLPSHAVYLWNPYDPMHLSLCVADHRVKVGCMASCHVTGVHAINPRRNMVFYLRSSYGNHALHVELSMLDVIVFHALSSSSLAPLSGFLAPLYSVFPHPDMPQA